ncbi:hypothetical protein HZC30_01455 [Candidatus Woesearchaeota archaeon]|nr:hypothetical protein [Candidatus Woesearchaeota archaeon]
MALHREIIVLGDIEMGGGTLTDDFIGDNALSKLLLELNRRPHPLDLILNGDTFDFLKCPYSKGGKLAYTRHITAEVSLSKLDLMYSAHKKVFDALTKFIRLPQHNLFFVFGNHDLDLVFPQVQEKIRKILWAKSNVHFIIRYNADGVYVEHGMQYDYLNKIDFQKVFLKHKGKELLNLSWVSFGLIGKMLPLKEEHPFLERLMDRPRLFTINKFLRKRIAWKVTEYFFKSMVYYPWRYITDPTYAFPRGLFREFLRRMKHTHWEVDTIVSVFKRNKRRSLHKNKIYVLGHVHHHYMEEKEGRVIIHSGSWRDEYDLDKNSHLVPRVKKYVQVLIGDGRCEYQVISYPLKRSKFKLEDALKNEKKCLKTAAKEEGYDLTL